MSNLSAALDGSAVGADVHSELSRIPNSVGFAVAKQEDGQVLASDGELAEDAEGVVQTALNMLMDARAALGLRAAEDEAAKGKKSGAEDGKGLARFQSITVSFEGSQFAITLANGLVYVVKTKKSDGASEEDDDDDEEEEDEEEDDDVADQ